MDESCQGCGARSRCGLRGERTGGRRIGHMRHHVAPTYRHFAMHCPFAFAAVYRPNQPDARTPFPPPHTPPLPRIQNKSHRRHILGVVA